MKIKLNGKEYTVKFGYAPVVVVVYNLLIKANNTELQQDSEAISLQVEK